MQFKHFIYKLNAFFIFLFIFTLFGNAPINAATNYWIQFGTPGKPSSDWDTAEELLEKLSNNGIQATELNRWKNSGWDGHIKDFPFNNFDIKAEEGYFLKITTNELDIENILNDYETYIPSEYELSIGWNLINFPKGFKEEYEIFQAEDICKNIGSTLSEVAYTEPMEEQLKPIDESPGYKSHQCGSSDNNFEIKEAHSYFLKGTDYSTWKPEKKQKAYFVFWGPKGIPGDSWNKAKELLDKLNAEGVFATEIDRWKNSGWDGHVKGFPFNDFEINAGEGYIISVDNPQANIHDILDSWTDINSMTYELKASWNLISFPKTLIEGNSQFTNASDLCEYDGVTEIQYTRYYEKNTEANYTNYECGDNNDNFSLESGLSYFVKSSKNTTFTLSKEAALTTENKPEPSKSNDDDNDKDQTTQISKKDAVPSLPKSIQETTPNALQAITVPLGQILGKDFTNFSFYDSLMILLISLIVLLLIVLTLVFVVYIARKKGALPSIRGYIKTKSATLFKIPKHKV